MGVALVLPVSPLVLAQDEAEDTIVVTGTRIQRRDFVSNSPIVTIDAEQFESRMGLNIESYLNQMPEFNPATTPVTSQGDVQITPVNSVGIASLSLRGFGPNRSLILVDGHRPVPTNALMVTDINGIPSAMIQRAETITGGASAVYGADAIGGVTNFILRDDFEGLEVDTQYGISEQGDSAEYRVSSILGANIMEGRGNITVGMEYYNRERALNKERDFFTDAWESPEVAGNFLDFLQGVSGYSCGFNCPNANAANALFPNKPAGTTITNPGSYFFGNIGFLTNFFFNPNGTVFVNGSRAGLTKLDQSIIDGQKYILRNVYDNSVPASAPGAPVETQQLKYSFTDGFTQAPQERYSFMLNGHYDLSDRLTLNSRVTWAQSKTRTRLGGNSAIFGWEAQIPYNATTDSPYDTALVNELDPTGAGIAALLANPAAFTNPNFIPHGSGTLTYCQAGAAGCTPGVGQTSLATKQVGVAAGSTLIGTPVNYHPVPLELAVLLNSRGNAAGAWIPQWQTDDSFDFRNTNNVNTVWQFEGGFDYELPFKDWIGELYLSYGETSTSNIAGGNMSLSRYRVLAGLPDYGRNAVVSGNSVFLIPGANPAASTVLSAARPFFGAGDVTCASGFYDTYFSGQLRPSEDCIDAINATLQTRGSNQQAIVEVNLQGGIMELPAGELRGAAGFQWRQNKAQFVPDLLQSEVSFTDQVIGVYPTGYLDAKTEVKDYYAEALVPLLSDLPFLQKLELETGARYSDYDTADSTWTYKFLGNAEVNDWFRLRGGYNRATRAPNVGELFLNLQEIFGAGAFYGDACGWQSSAPWGASGAMNRPGGVPNPGVPSALAGGQTLAGATSTYLICQAQMTAQGTTTYYNSTFNSGAAGSAFAWVLQEGNENLKSEKADTFTAGFTLTSPLETPWLSGFSATVDWWKVDIEDAIQQYSLDYASYLCYGTNIVANAAEAAAQAATPACKRVPRNINDGSALTATVAYDNLATIVTSGIDFGVNWIANLGELGLFGNVPGSVAINAQATWLDYYKTRASSLPFDLEIDWKDSLGPTLSGTNPGAYEYRVFTNFTYFQDNWSVSLRWRHLPPVWTATAKQQQTLIANNERVAAGADGTIFTYTPGGFVKVGAYDVLDLAFSWDINEMWSLRGGINNVIDFEPESTGRFTGFPAGTTLSAVCGGAPGCVAPTNFSRPNPGLGATSPGYYDTIGRRFFVGLKANF
jgi:outer membrane receptor protein involved in Fe transport